MPAALTVLSLIVPAGHHRAKHQGDERGRPKCSRVVLTGWLSQDIKHVIVNMVARKSDLAEKSEELLSRVQTQSEALAVNGPLVDVLGLDDGKLWSEGAHHQLSAAPPSTASLAHSSRPVPEADPG